MCVRSVCVTWRMAGSARKCVTLSPASSQLTLAGEFGVHEFPCGGSAQECGSCSTRRRQAGHRAASFAREAAGSGADQPVAGPWVRPLSFSVLIYECSLCNDIVASGLGVFSRADPPSWNSHRSLLGRCTTPLSPLVASSRVSAVCMGMKYSWSPTTLLSRVRRIQLGVIREACSLLFMQSHIEVVCYFSQAVRTIPSR